MTCRMRFSHDKVGSEQLPGFLNRTSEEHCGFSMILILAIQGRVTASSVNKDLGHS